MYTIARTLTFHDISYNYYLNAGTTTGVAIALFTIIVVVLCVVRHKYYRNKSASVELNQQDDDYGYELASMRVTIIIRCSSFFYRNAVYSSISDARDVANGVFSDIESPQATYMVSPGPCQKKVIEMCFRRWGHTL